MTSEKQHSIIMTTYQSEEGLIQNFNVINIKSSDIYEMRSLHMTHSNKPLKVMLLNPWSINSMEIFGNFKELLQFLNTNFDFITIPE